MKKAFETDFFLLCACLVAAASCCKVDHEAPLIDGVWMNMIGRPIEMVDFAYPGQTLCLRGEHFGNLKRVIVNGKDINLNTLFVYESTTAITFTLPSDAKTSGDYIRVVTSWGENEIPFVVRPLDSQPLITAFSATTLVPGRTLSITGVNLEGATKVFLPLTFDGTVECSLSEEQPKDGTGVNVIIPDGVDFATGTCVIVMEKYDSDRSLTYTEKVFSEETSFRN